MRKREEHVDVAVADVEDLPQVEESERDAISDAIPAQTDIDRQALTQITQEARQQYALARARLIVVTANGRGMDTHPEQARQEAIAWRDRVAALEHAVEVFTATGAIPFSELDVARVIPRPDGGD